jgi:hypothetical protein
MLHIELEVLLQIVDFRLIGINDVDPTEAVFGLGVANDELGNIRGDFFEVGHMKK